MGIRGFCGKRKEMVISMSVTPKVTLIAYTPNPEYTVANAAKLCYSPATIATVRDGLDDEKVGKFVEMLSEMGHESPVEHTSFTFGIEGVSRSFLAQITRHRLASYSVQSQRYVREDQFGYILPPEIAECEEAKTIYKEAMKRDQEDYDRLAALLKEKHKAAFLAQGKDEKTAARLAEKKAIEDARFVLPNACETKMIVTMNARSLLHFFAQRCCNRAQWEIREVADQMLALCYPLAPHIFKNAGPGCVSGRCPEGKMTCGMACEMQRRIADLKGIKE